MNITIIGAGNIGGTLAKGWSRVGHRVFLGVRDTGSDKVKALTAFNKNITAHPEAANEISGKLGDVRKKIIIDCMNSVRTTGYPSSSHSRRSGSTSPFSRGRGGRSRSS